MKLHELDKEKMLKIKPTELAHEVSSARPWLFQDKSQED